MFSRKDLVYAQVVDAYHGPKIATSLHNPYIFALFKQPGHITVTEAIRNITKTFSMTPTSAATASTFKQLVDALGLGGTCVWKGVISINRVLTCMFVCLHKVRRNEILHNNIQLNTCTCCSLTQLIGLTFMHIPTFRSVIDKELVP